MAGYRSTMVCAPLARWMTWFLKSGQLIRSRLIELACMVFRSSSVYALARADAADLQRRRLRRRRRRRGTTAARLTENGGREKPSPEGRHRRRFYGELRDSTPSCATQRQVIGGP